MKPVSKVKFDAWTPSLAYAAGLIVTDGSLSRDSRHINLTSKDLSQILCYKDCLGLKNNIGMKAKGGEVQKRYHVLQFGDVKFYKFLNSLGIHSNKSKVIGTIRIPDYFFRDFLRGHFDGDGSSYSYWDRRWKASFMFYISFVSASSNHIEWLRSKILKNTGITGHITKQARQACYQLRYAKNEAVKLVNYMYYPCAMCLKRKLLKIQLVLDIIYKRNVSI
jgi:hypothetical protein